MGLMFGTQDEIDCILPQKFEGPNGAQVCLAKKISLRFVGAGVYVSDGGYVLRMDGGKSYFPLDDGTIRELQAANLVPTPLPKYSITPWQYLFGYSLWIVLLVVAVATVAHRVFGKLRPFLADEVAAVTGPPMVRTEDDKWLVTELGKHLEPGERLQHQALTTNFAPGEATKGAASFYLGLTDRRLIILETAQGFLGPKREGKNPRFRARTEIAALGQDQLHIQIAFNDGQVEHYWVAGSQRKLSNQWLFARDVPRLLSTIGQATSA